MTPLKRWYLEMRLAGHSHEEILKLSHDRYKEGLRETQEAYLERVHEIVPRFQEEAAALVGRVAEVGDGEAEMAALEESAEIVDNLAMATAQLRSESKKIQAEQALEVALKAKLKVQLEALKKAPKRPIFSAIEGHQPRSWDKSKPGAM